MEKTRCQICGSFKCRFLLKGQDRLLGLPGEFRVMVCEDCGIKFTDPKSIKLDLKEYYPDQYSPYKVGSNGLATKSASLAERIKIGLKKSPLGPILRRIANTNEVYIPNLPLGSKVLEIGCASGNFLFSLRSRGWDLYGVEMSKFAAIEANKRGLKVFCGILEEAKFQDGFFNAIFAYHVVEHLPDPISTLKEIKRVLAKDSYFIFSIPNAECWEFKVFKSRWYALDLPRHLYHFGPSSIKKVLDKGGFEIEHIYYQKNMNNIFGSAAYIIEEYFKKNTLSRYLLTFPNASNRFFRFLLLPLNLFFEIIGQSGRITIVARPKA